MGNATSRSLRKNKDSRKELTVGDLIAAFYDEAQRVSDDREEADVLAKASLLQAMRHGHVKTRHHG